MRRRTVFKLLYLILFLIIYTILLYNIIIFSINYQFVDKAEDTNENIPCIVVITPTHRRNNRLGDLTRLHNTLAHVNSVLWILVEDGRKSDAVQLFLRSSRVPVRYISSRSANASARGWSQRNRALDYLEQYEETELDNCSHSVVYFADDDNSYDIRLFENYIRKVKRIGVWAVGLVGNTLVESAQVSNGKVIGWNVIWFPNRPFPIDMAGFAVSWSLVRRYSARFSGECVLWYGAPESCFLQKMNLSREDLEPFGWESRREASQEVLVWHTKTLWQKHFLTDVYDKRYSVET